MFELIPVTNKEQLCELAEMACGIWHECFPGIISTEQIDYMVKRFQSYEAMCRQTEQEGYRYYFITADGERAGYLGCASDEENGRMFLSKLYLLSDYRGRGLASRAITALEGISRRKGLTAIRLTVNIHNEQAIAVYKHCGFRVVFDQKADIGSGFFMDDHVMEKTL